MSYRVHTQVEIDAPASVVWELLIDLDGYQRWNPFIPRARGRIVPGGRVEVSPKLTARRQTTFRPAPDTPATAWRAAASRPVANGAADPPRHPGDLAPA